MAKSNELVNQLNFINIFLINKMTIKTIEDTKTGLLNEKILLNTNKL